MMTANKPPKPTPSEDAKIRADWDEYFSKEVMRLEKDYRKYMEAKRRDGIVWKIIIP